jgi:hypothetical protein
MGQEIALTSGLMKITYDTGAKVILQGPVTYVIESKNGGFMSIGKLVGSVTTADAKGFAIRTPNAIVTDLGTEFGVEVDENRITQTHVFVGAVQVGPIGEQQGDVPSPQMVSAGQHVEVGVKGNVRFIHGEKDVEKSPSRFIRTIPADTSVKDAYAKLVLSMDPVVYYRMDHWPATDRQNHYVLVDAAPGGRHGVVVADAAFGTPVCQGAFGLAIDRRGSMGGDEYAFVGDYPKAASNQVSVSARVRPVQVEPFDVIACNWYYDKPSDKAIGQFVFGVRDKYELMAEILQPNEERVEAVGTSRLARGKWQHVAMVADGAILHLYCNGAEIGNVPYHGIAQQQWPRCLSVGCAMNEEGTAVREGWPCRWNGQLDEIAIFNHALSPEQVRQLSTKTGTLRTKETGQ